MPALEIPAELRDSSSDSSLSVELSPPRTPPAGNYAVNAAAQIQIRILPPPALPDLPFHPPQQQQRRFSYDRDLDEFEEDNHWPARPYLLPVVLPQVTEPTLDELLRRVTGRTDLQNVDTVKLRVISYMVSLSRLSLFLPRLAHLDLSGSVLNSLRDLGCGLLHLIHLNVSNCGLSSFDGTSGLPSVQELIADGNMVQLVSPLADLPLLKRLSARNNRIGDLGSLSFLGLCTNLLELELQGNPVTRLILYRLTLQRSVPSLQMLDGERLQATGQTAAETVTTVTVMQRPAQNDDESSSDETETPISSLSSDIYSATHSDAGNSDAAQSDAAVNSDALIATTTNSSATNLNARNSAPSGSDHNINNAIERPSTTCGVERRCSSEQHQPERRPASTSVIGSIAQRRSLTLTTTEPLVGSVLALARQRKRHVWGSSSSSNSSSNSSLAATSDGIGNQHLRDIATHTHPLRRQTTLPPINTTHSAHSSLSSSE